MKHIFATNKKGERYKYIFENVSDIPFEKLGINVNPTTIRDTKGELLADGVTLSDGGYDEADVIERSVQTVESSIAVPTGTFDQDGKEIYTFETKVFLQKMVTLKPEYDLEVIDLEKDYDYKLQKCLEKRRNEYPDAAEFLNAYFDDGEAGIEVLRQKRQAIKQKYPKPTK